MFTALLAAGLVLIVLCAFLFALWRGQERVLFQPPSAWESAEVSGRVYLQASDGQRLIAYMVGNTAQAHRVLLCFHGNADLAIWQHAWAERVAILTDCLVVLVEYRGYMGLGGTPTYPTSALDADAAYNYVTSVLDVKQSDIAYYGHSLGSAVATELARRHPPVALLLQSPFSSARAMARLMISPPVEIVWSRLSRIHFDTVGVVSTLDVPVSVAHGKRDRVVPFRMGLQIYEAARTKGELLIVEHGGHNDLETIGGDEYWKWIVASLATRAGPRA